MIDTESGDRTMNFNICAVTKPLASVMRLVERGHQVTFDSEGNGGSYILNHQTGEGTMMEMRRGVYVIAAKPRSGSRGRPEQASRRNRRHKPATHQSHKTERARVEGARRGRGGSRGGRQ